MSDSLELDFLRYSNLPEQVQSAATEQGHFYLAVLISGGATLAPEYRFEDENGQVIGRTVLPSGLANVELHLIEWMLNFDIRHQIKPAGHR